MYILQLDKIFNSVSKRSVTFYKCNRYFRIKTHTMIKQEIYIYIMNQIKNEYYQINIQ